MIDWLIDSAVIVNSKLDYWPSGSLSNDGVDVNENGKQAIGLDWQNNNFARA